MNRLIRVVRSKTFIILVTCVVVYTLAGFFLIPALVRHYVPAMVQEQLKKQAVIGKVRVNPYLFTIEAGDFVLREADGKAIASFRRLFIDFEMKSIFNWAWTFRQIHLEGPSVNAVMDENGGLNLAQLVPPSPPDQDPDSDPEDTALPRLILEEIQVNRGRIAVTDQRQRTPAAIAFDPLDVKATNLTTLKDKPGDLAVTAATQAGETLRWESIVHLNPIRLEGRIAAEGFHLATPWAFFKDTLPLEKPGGRIHVAADIDADLAGAPQITLDGLSVEFTSVGLWVTDNGTPIPVAPGLRIDGERLELNAGSVKIDVPRDDRGTAQSSGPVQVKVDGLAAKVAGIRLKSPAEETPVLKLDAVQLGGGAFDLAANRVTADTVAVDGGAVTIRREKDGRLNLSAMLVSSESKKEEMPASNSETDNKQENVPANDGAPFEFFIKRVQLSGVTADLSDLTVGNEDPLIRLDDVRMTVSDVDGSSPMNFKLGIDVGQGGMIEADGVVDPIAPSVTSQIRVEALALGPLQPYIDQVAEVELKSGTFSTEITMTYGSAQDQARTVLKGGFQIETLRMVEQGSDETLVGCQSLQAEEFSLTLAPNYTEIAIVRVVQPVGKIVIDANQHFNLADVVKKREDAGKGPTPAAPEPEEGMPFRVGQVIVEDGRVDFSDLSLPIPFGSKIHELNGNMVGLSSRDNQRAQVELDGRVDEYGMVKVDGEINTSNPKGFTDIGVVFNNVEMTHLTPYSGKFAGRRIDSGKLSANLQYKIEDSQLAGNNQIVVDRLTLGERVESPDAVSLPLDLAVALLKDANGVIDLGLPVKGSLDAPEFSLGGIVWKAIVNLLTKIVTSPFRAIAALIPGGSEDALKAVSFEPGSADLPPPEKEKLAKLAGALKKRPQLKLMVKGGFDAAADGKQLRKAALIRDLDTALAGGKSPSSVQTALVDFSNPDVVGALEKIFIERFGVDALSALKERLKAEVEKTKKENANPSAIDGARLAKELFARLQEAQPIDGAALTRLAEARAAAVAAEMSGPLALPAERVGVTPAGAGEKVGNAEALLSLEALK